MLGSGDMHAQRPQAARASVPRRMSASIRPTPCALASAPRQDKDVGGGKWEHKGAGADAEARERGSGPACRCRGRARAGRHYQHGTTTRKCWYSTSKAPAQHQDGIKQVPVQSYYIGSRVTAWYHCSISTVLVHYQCSASAVSVQFGCNTSAVSEAYINNTNAEPV